MYRTRNDLRMGMLKQVSSRIGDVVPNVMVFVGYFIRIEKKWKIIKLICGGNTFFRMGSIPTQI